MFKKGDIVRIKSLGEILDIEGVSNYVDIRHPHISIAMLRSFGKEGVVLGTSSHGNIILAISESECPCYYNPKWLDKISDMITLKDFEKNIIDLGFYMSKESNIVRVYSKDDQILMSLDLSQRGCVDTLWNGFVHINDWGVQSKLLDLGVKLARTPIDKRNEPKKYYLRLPLPFQGFKPLFLYYNQKTKQYLIDDGLFPAHSEQDQFTQEEIDNLPNQDFIKTLIKEEVEE